MYYTIVNATSSFTTDNYNNDETSSINDIYFVYTVKKGDVENNNHPCFREMADGYRLVGPYISKFFHDKVSALEYGKDLMRAFISGQDNMRQQFRILLNVK